jgi:peptide/nickel transport system ATP-binding protein
VMQRGQTVEMLPSADLAAHKVTNAYTLQLMQASSGFKRAAEVV